MVQVQKGGLRTVVGTKTFEISVGLLSDFHKGLKAAAGLGP